MNAATRSAAPASAQRAGVLLAELILLLLSIGVLLMTPGREAGVVVPTRLLSSLLGVPLALIAALAAAELGPATGWFSVRNALAAGAALGALFSVCERGAAPFAIAGAMLATTNLLGLLLSGAVPNQVNQGPKS